MIDRPDDVTNFLREIGRKGGKQSLKTMTKEERSERAREAGKAGGVARRKAAAAKGEKDEAAVSLGRRGGKAKVPKGTAMLTPEERIARGKKGAEARWGKKAKKKKP